MPGHQQQPGCLLDISGEVPFQQSPLLSPALARNERVVLAIPAESESQIIVPLPKGNGTMKSISVVDACPETQMANLRPYLLRARDGLASKAEVGDETPLCFAEADRKEQLAGIIVDLAASAVRQSVMALLELLQQRRSSNGGVRLDALGAWNIQLLTSLNAQARPEIHTFSEIEIP